MSTDASLLHFGMMYHCSHRTQHDQLHIPQRRRRVDCHRKIQAIHLRHLHIQQQYIERFTVIRRLMQSLERNGGRCRFDDIHAPVLQLESQYLPVGGIVIHN